MLRRFPSSTFISQMWLFTERRGAIDRALPCSHLDPDWCADEAKCVANLVFEKPLIRKMQLHLTVRKQDKRWRSHRRLRQIQNLYTLTNRHGSAVKIHVLQKAVHLASGNALPPLGCDFFEHGKYFVHTFASCRRNEQQRRVVQKL